ncbi:MAG: 30S ribosomal protein S1 [Armatimonadetes bacterium]|nr:30S ribosomal protein S1 [Armatimonadota bacterium]
MTYDKEAYEATPLEKTGSNKSEAKSEDLVMNNEQLTESEVSEPATTFTEGAEKKAEVSVEAETKAEEKAPEPDSAATSAEEAEPQSVKKTSERGDHYSETFRSLSEGDLVDGVVVHIDKDGVLVDVGTKSEGIIKMTELAQEPFQSPEEVVSVGDRINVYVMETESQDGSLLLSKKRADFENAWNRVIQHYEEDKPITAMVTDRVKGGLVVDLGVRGFIPASHVGSGNVKNLDKYIGQSLPLKIIEVDRDRRKVVLSHKLAVESEREKRRAETIKSLQEGQIREGIVRRITDYGAFIDLGGIDGLLHVSEMSWTRINHPSEVVKVGQKIQVMVLKLNLEADRISLGLRQILPDPWADIESKYSVGQVIEGEISRLVPFGAFVRLDEGIEGIIPNVELSRKRVKKPEDVVKVGDHVEARIVELKPEERRMTLSIRQILEEKEKSEYETYRPAQDEGRMTLGDLVGDKLRELRSVVEEVEDQPSRKRKKKQHIKADEEDFEADVAGPSFAEETLSKKDDEAEAEIKAVAIEVEGVQTEIQEACEEVNSSTNEAVSEISSTEEAMKQSTTGAEEEPGEE